MDEKGDIVGTTATLLVQRCFIDVSFLGAGYFGENRVHKTFGNCLKSRLFHIHP